ncbi:MULTISPECIES: murein hydrolase activator EnvC [unclassified Curtobacterium]|uniref:murein hydrolase activator EnvC family protein n=1 Tax=unclassified Curtobacterium TaxID=257496 RepID=UPI000DAAB262|nr:MULTISPECIES: M23 family metallopeptidase [unclassified Curtobacterium]PZE70959.1 M23 family peptidase [Curtobacterium sp. MCLR17_059]PZF55174.1 M23 family peptidase [Curtobacterium sp. MCLR17_057]
MRSSARPVLLSVVCAAVLGGTAVFGAAPSTGAGVSVGAGASVGTVTDSGRVEARWVWPTRSRVVERAWEAPSSDYTAGHRGLDVSAALGSTASAVDDGTVLFAGPVGGRTVVTIDHGDGLVSTLDSVTPLVAAGDEVVQGAPVGRVSVGHCPASAPCLHLGARVDGRYVDPMAYLPPAEWPVLLPESAWPG